MSSASHTCGEPLPERPSLEQQKKRARELLKAARAGDPQALARFRAHPRRRRTSGRPGEPAGARVALHEAQRVIAREYGFPSWEKLKARIEALAARRTRAFVKDIAWYEERARGLVSMHQGGLPEALAQIREWHPRLARAADEEIRAAAFTDEDARLVYARQHGFEAWEGLAAHVEALARGAADEPFLVAYEALRQADLPRLRALLGVHPDLARARGTNGNTLLHLASSLWSEHLACRREARQPAVEAGFEFFRLLIEAGGDLNQPNERGWTALHSAAYGNQLELARWLLGHGAAVDREAHGEGGTPLAVALFWGHREVAGILAERAVVPDNLRVAAGLGRADLARRLFMSGGALAPEAARGRGFYRPHSGFPVWRPSADSQEILDEALVWAAKADRVEVLPLLVAHGADVNADPYRGTPLGWAAACGRLDAARWLLDHGADVNRQATFGGPTHGQGVTALHLCAQNSDFPMVRFLVERGADPQIKDELYHSSACGWAAHFEKTAVRAYLESRRG